jgi:hypothetical protein
LEKTRQLRILICGDSYSHEDLIIDDFKPTYTWISLLKNDYTVHSVGQAGASNLTILEQVLKNTRNKEAWDYIIVSLAPLLRDSNSLKHSIKIVHTIIKQVNQIAHNSYVWSCFEDFRNIVSIDWQPFVAYNEQFIKMQNEEKHKTTHYTGCHFTQEGNKAVYEHMKYIINRGEHNNVIDKRSST